MNAIAAHKDELEKLPDDFAERKSGLRDSVPGCLHSASRQELPRHQGPLHSAAIANQRRINVQPTLTRNCALYYAQHKASKGRATLFRKFRAAARKAAPDVRRQLIFGELLVVPSLHQDNGR
jgi:hypothetical protein